ncbi:MAG: Glyoxalase family protein, partial [uncultured Thermomicrobiales bacterium]
QRPGRHDHRDRHARAGLGDRRAGRSARNRAPRAAAADDGREPGRRADPRRDVAGAGRDRRSRHGLVDRDAPHHGDRLGHRADARLFQWPPPDAPGQDDRQLRRSGLGALVLGRRGWPPRYLHHLLRARPGQGARADGGGANAPLRARRARRGVATCVARGVDRGRAAGLPGAGPHLLQEHLYERPGRAHRGAGDGRAGLRGRRGAGRARGTAATPPLARAAPRGNRGGPAPPDRRALGPHRCHRRGTAM